MTIEELRNKFEDTKASVKAMTQQFLDQLNDTKKQFAEKETVELWPNSGLMVTEEEVNLDIETTKKLIDAIENRTFEEFIEYYLTEEYFFGTLDNKLFEKGGK